MKLFAILAPQAAADLEGGRATKTGFAWGALVFGPLWLLARGMWLALLAYAVLAAAVFALVGIGGLSPGAALGLAALGHLYLAVEGRALAIAARERSGRLLVDLVYARSALEAEKIYLERVLRPVAPAPRRGFPPALPDVIGLFPEPGR